MSIIFCKFVFIFYCIYYFVLGVIYKERMECLELVDIYCGLYFILWKFSGFLMGWDSMVLESFGIEVGECWWLVWWFLVN